MQGQSGLREPIGRAGKDVMIEDGEHMLDDRAGGARIAASEKELVQEIGRLLKDTRERQASIAAAEQVVGELGGALDRTLDSLRPYLLQLRFDRGAADA